MDYVINIRIVKILRILEGMTIDDNNTIIDNDSNFFINSLDNKSPKKQKRNKSINMAIIIQESDFHLLCNLFNRSKYI